MFGSGQPPAQQTKVATKVRTSDLPPPSEGTGKNAGKPFDIGAGQPPPRGPTQQLVLSRPPQTSSGGRGGGPGKLFTFGTAWLPGPPTPQEAAAMPSDTHLYSATVRDLQLDWTPSTRIRKINLPANQKDQDKSKTAIGKLLVRRIKTCHESIFVLFIFDLVFKITFKIMPKQK